MSNNVDVDTAIVIPNWNGQNDLPACLTSLLAQTIDCEIIVVENGSTDKSREILVKDFPSVTALLQNKNLGFAGGVNVGMQYAIDSGYKYIALFNNDAIAETDWLEKLRSDMLVTNEAGTVTGTLVRSDGQRLDSQGEAYTNWGLPYATGRDLDVKQSQNTPRLLFGATGGASLYRVAALRETGLFDVDFFAYYEDVDLSFRMQNLGWKIYYVEDAKAYHRVGATSARIKGFTTYQTMKNLPLIAIKNVPRKYLWHVMLRLTLARTLFMARAITRGQGLAAIRGDAMATKLIFKKLRERKQIQSTKKVSDEYIWNIITHDLPPNATALRKLRAVYWKIARKTAK